MIVCVRCDIGKPNDRFNLSNICKECEKEIILERKIRNYNSCRNSRYKRNYKIDLEQYNRKLKDQDYKCFICNKHESKLKRKLCVDHHHETGTVRALLCSNCNSALGLLFEDPKIIEQLLIYAKNFKRALDYMSNEL